MPISASVTANLKTAKIDTRAPAGPGATDQATTKIPVLPSEAPAFVTAANKITTPETLAAALASIPPVFPPISPVTSFITALVPSIPASLEHAILGQKNLTVLRSTLFSGGKSRRWPQARAEKSGSACKAYAENQPSACRIGFVSWPRLHRIEKTANRSAEKVPVHDVPLLWFVVLSRRCKTMPRSMSNATIAGSESWSSPKLAASMQGPAVRALISLGSQPLDQASLFPMDREWQRQIARNSEEKGSAVPMTVRAETHTPPHPPELTHGPRRRPLPIFEPML